MKLLKYTLIWFTAIILTVTTSIYQRLTGPTHPYRTTININGESLKLKLIRSHGGETDAPLVLPILDKKVKAIIQYKKHPSTNEFITDTFKMSDNGLTFMLPNQPPAGKLKYIINIQSQNDSVNIPQQIIRFKGDVPVYWLLPHILLMFLAILLSFSTGLTALLKYPVYTVYAAWAAATFFTGGLILGPIVQKFAFGDWWTGIPFGWDLTDNKTLIAAVFWVIAIAKNYKQPSRTWTLIACVVMILVYAIPHSLFGSELDHETGKVIQGFITFPIWF